MDIISMFDHHNIRDSIHILVDFSFVTPFICYRYVFELEGSSILVIQLEYRSDLEITGMTCSSRRYINGVYINLAIIMLHGISSLASHGFNLRV